MMLTAEQSTVVVAMPTPAQYSITLTSASPVCGVVPAKRPGTQSRTFSCHGDKALASVMQEGCVVLDLRLRAQDGRPYNRTAMHLLTTADLAEPSATFGCLSLAANDIMR